MPTMQVQVAGAAYACQLADEPRQQFLNGNWDALGELLDVLPQARETVKLLPCLRAFA